MQINRPLVSVVIPTRDRAELLRRAIESVRNQTHQDFEIVVVDDGSKESARPMVDRMNDSRIHYMRNEESLGGGAARNRGIRTSVAPIIAFLDDDDVWERAKLATQVSALQTHPEAVYSFTAARIRFPGREHVTAVPQGIGEYHTRALSRFSGVLTSTLLVRRNALEESGLFDESLPSHQEAELLIRLSRVGRGYGINEPLVIMESSEGHAHIGASLERRIAGRRALLEKHAAEFTEHPALLAKHIREIGFWQRDIGDQSGARTSFARSFLLFPSPRTAVHFISTLLPKFSRRN